MPFATINCNNGTNTVTDVDGKFQILSKTAITSFEVSYLGFLKKTIEIESKKNYYVYILQNQSKLFHTDFIILI